MRNDITPDDLKKMKLANIEAVDAEACRGFALCDVNLYTAVTRNVDIGLSYGIMSRKCLLDGRNIDIRGYLALGVYLLLLEPAAHRLLIDERVSIAALNADVGLGNHLLRSVLI